MLLPMVIKRTMLSRKAGSCAIIRRRRLSARSQSRKYVSTASMMKDTTPDTGPRNTQASTAPATTGMAIRR
ncbi:hypothetical protein D3C78_1813110 [compost metagenome]